MLGFNYLVSFIRRYLLLKKSIKIKNEIKILRSAKKDSTQLIPYKLLNIITKNNINFEININFFNKYLLDFDVNKFFKQLILYKILANRTFYKKIILCYQKKEKIVYPIPKELNDIFKNEGLNVSILSRFYLILFGFREFIKSNLLIVKILFEINNLREEEHIQFCEQIDESNFNSISKEKMNLLTWYSDNFKKNRINNIYFVGNQKKRKFGNFTINFNNQVIEQLSFLKKIQFFIFSIFFSFYALLKFVIGKYYYLLILCEIILLIKSILSQNKAKEYFFSNSNYIFKPLWTYHVELMQKKVSLFHYSSSFFGFKINNSYLPNESGIESMTWKNIYLWTEPLSSFLQKNIIKKNINFILTNPIDLNDNDENFANVTKGKKVLSIFDIPPRRSSIREMYFYGDNYRTENTSIKFLEDINNVFGKKNNFVLLLKTKRIMDKEYSKKYKMFVQDFISKKNVYLLKPTTSASRIIVNSDLIISIPWTSTAFIGKFYNKKSFFYDPLETLDFRDRGKQNCELIQGKKNLQKLYDIF